MKDINYYVINVNTGLVKGCFRTPNDAIGVNFEEGDVLVSDVTREELDNLKEKLYLAQVQVNQLEDQLIRNNIMNK